MVIGLLDEFSDAGADGTVGSVKLLGHGTVRKGTVHHPAGQTIQLIQFRRTIEAGLPMITFSVFCFFGFLEAAPRLFVDRSYV